MLFSVRRLKSSEIVWNTRTPILCNPLQTLLIYIYGDRYRMFIHILLFGLEVVSYLASCHDVTKVVLPWCHLRPRGRVVRTARYGGGSDSHT